MTDQELLTMYAQHPAALAEEVDYVLADLATEKDMAFHANAMERIRRLCPVAIRARLLTNVANAILATAREGVPDGKASSGKTG